MPKLNKPNLIIQIRGTSGSGKTTLMRGLREQLGKVWTPAFIEGRRNPLYYAIFPNQSGLSKEISVLGSYESTCGGVDTIHGYPLLIKTVEEAHERGHVIMEGLLLSEDVKQTLTLLPRKLKIVFLDTPIEECIRRIKNRRAEAGNDKPLKEDNTRKRVAVIDRARVRLREAGIECVTTSCENALPLVLDWLRS